MILIWIGNHPNRPNENGKPNPQDCCNYTPIPHENRLRLFAYRWMWLIRGDPS